MLIPPFWHLPKNDERPSPESNGDGEVGSLEVLLPQFGYRLTKEVSSKRGFQSSFRIGDGLPLCETNGR